MKAKDFPHYTRSQFPPGFLALARTSDDRSPRGVIPDKKGNCQWVQAIKGRQSHGEDTLCIELLEEDWKASQRLWLRHLRLVQLKTAKGIEAEIGVSPRTWQGWEGGKAIPYFRAARLALLTWENSRARSLEEGW
jgi:hypothetical protein